MHTVRVHLWIITLAHWESHNSTFGSFREIYKGVTCFVLKELVSSIPSIQKVFYSIVTNKKRVLSLTILVKFKSNDSNNKMLHLWNLHNLMRENLWSGLGFSLEISITHESSPYFIMNHVISKGWACSLRLLIKTNNRGRVRKLACDYWMHCAIPHRAIQKYPVYMTVRQTWPLAQAQTHKQNHQAAEGIIWTSGCGSSSLFGVGPQPILVGNICNDCF
jgi:hypothetical protein